MSSESTQLESSPLSIAFQSGLLQHEHITVQDVSAAIEFCIQEKSYWEGVKTDGSGDPAAKFADRCISHYLHFKQRFEAAVHQKLPVGESLESLTTELSKGTLRGTKILVLLSRSPSTKELREALKDRDIGPGILAYLGFGNIGEHVHRPGEDSTHIMKGFLIAHAIREKYLIPSLTMDQSILESLQSILQDARTAYSVALKELSEERSSIEAMKDSLERGIDSTIESANRDWTDEKSRRETEATETKEVFENLRLRFQEQLRLRGPSEQWSKAGTRNMYWGIGWSALLIGTIICSIKLILALMYNTPEIFSASITEWSSPKTIKGILLFGALLSLVAFSVRTFSKLALSSFHLQRDAAERLTLTSYFLALIEEGAIEPSEREIILKALFSRADTGLLSVADHAPIMPSGTSVLNRVTGGKTND